MYISKEYLAILRHYFKLDFNDACRIQQIERNEIISNYIAKTGLSVFTMITYSLKEKLEVEDQFLIMTL